MIFDERREGRRHRVGDRVDDRLAPLVAARGHDEQRPAAAVRAHRHGQLHQHVDRADPGLRGVEPEQRRQQLRAIGQRGRAISSTSFTWSPSSTATFTYLPACAPRWCFTTSSPARRPPARSRARESICVVPHTRSSPSSGQTPRWMPGRSTTGASLASVAGAQRQRTFEDERLLVLLGRQVGERDLRHVALLAPEAGPEGGVDHFADHAFVGHGGDAWLPGGEAAEVPGEVGVNLGRGQPGRRIAVEVHWTPEYVTDSTAGDSGQRGTGAAT